MFSDPVIEQYRLNAVSSRYSGVFTLVYPSPKKCIVLGFVSTQKIKPSHIKQLIKHIKCKGRSELIYYRVQHGLERECKIQLSELTTWHEK